MISGAVTRHLTLGALTLAIALYLAALSAPVVRHDISTAATSPPTSSTNTNNNTSVTATSGNNSNNNSTTTTTVISASYRIVSTLWRECVSAGSPALPPNPAAECASPPFACDSANDAARAARGLYIAAVVLAFVALSLAHLFAGGAVSDAATVGATEVESICDGVRKSRAGRAVGFLAVLSGVCGMAGWAVAISLYTVAQCGNAALESLHGAAMGASVPLAVAATGVSLLVVAPGALLAL